MRVVIWNPSKVSMCSNVSRKPNQSAYEHLQEVEKSGTLSSEITVDSQSHLDNILEAIYNETDVQLSFHILDESDNAA